MRTNDRVCTLEINTDMTSIVCSKCGWQVPHGTDPNLVRECPRCKRLVAYGAPRLYLIGPVTGLPNDNLQAFKEARSTLKADGYECDIPHHYIEQGTEWSRAMRISIRQMLATDGQSTIPLYDGIAMLDGWEDSVGATLERDIAKALDIPCRPWRDYLNPAAPASSPAAAPASQPLLSPAC